MAAAGSQAAQHPSCSSQGTVFCPGCCGWRSTQSAAHLVDEVFPHVRVRQWVLSLPLRLRYRLTWDHDLCRAVTGRALHAILIGVLACPRCGGGIAIVEDPAVIGRILRHLGLQATIPEPCPARSPPLFLAS